MRANKVAKEMKIWKKMLILGVAVVFTAGAGVLSPEIKGVQSSTLAPVTFPDAFDYEEGRDMHKIMEGNPVSDEFMASLQKFSYETSVKVFEDSQGNMNYSPLSLFYSLAMATSGAEGETLEEMLSLLNVKDKEYLSEQSGNYFRTLYFDNNIGKLKLANSLWMNQDVLWKESFIENAAKNFYTDTFQMDFKSSLTQDSMKAWIKENTQGTLEPEVELDPLQILSILNTVYFYDEWINTFDESQTKDDVFNVMNENKVNVPFMHNPYGSGLFFKGENFLRAGLQLKNQGSMVFILPDEGVDPKELIATPEKMRIAFEEGTEGYGEITWQIPKFSFHSKINLKENLKGLGLLSPFEEDANFTAITDQMAYISDILQETHIGIDEKGVEASSYTELSFVGTALPIDKAEMILNRPFLYGITSPQGQLIFVGICENPSLD